MTIFATIAISYAGIVTVLYVFVVRRWGRTSRMEENRERYAKLLEYDLLEQEAKWKTLR